MEAMVALRSLVTGIDGFIGSWLCEALIARGDEVHGLSRAREGSENGVARHRGEVSDAASVDAIVSKVKPDRVFHLAALNNVMDSVANPARTFEVNVGGTIHVLEALRRHAPGAHVVSVGSSSEYGRTASVSSALDETMPLAPNSPYGVSKAAAGMLASVYAKAHGLFVVHARPFAVIGPRKQRDAVSDFCKAVVAVERGEAPHVSIGNTESERDFVDVRDAASAMILVSEMGAPGETYDVCNGSRTSLTEVLSLLRSIAKVPFETTVDPARLRPVDDPRILGAGGKIRALGYTHRHALVETLAATLDHWRRAP
jgi:GDP-4-dehydro-6-deoxy-D-mannose reductase